MEHFQRPFALFYQTNFASYKNQITFRNFIFLPYLSKNRKMNVSQIVMSTPPQIGILIKFLEKICSEIQGKNSNKW